MNGLPPEALEEVSQYFQALAEPTRLQILNLLHGRERNVGELAQLCSFTAPNIARHFSVRTSPGVGARENRGTGVYARIAGHSAYALCDPVCGNIGRRFERLAAQRRAFTPATSEEQSK